MRSPLRLMRRFICWRLFSSSVTHRVRSGADRRLAPTAGRPRQAALLGHETTHPGGDPHGDRIRITYRWTQSGRPARRPHTLRISGRRRTIQDFYILPAAFEHGTLQRSAWREVRHRLDEIGALNPACGLCLYGVRWQDGVWQTLPDVVKVPCGTSRVSLWRLIHRVIVRAHREIPFDGSVGVLVRRETEGVPATENLVGRSRSRP